MEAHAMTMCTRSLHKSPLWTKCHSMGEMVTNILEDCMADVLYGGSFEFLDETRSHFTDECQLTLARDPANYVTDLKGKVIMKPELLTELCPQECEEHGTCSTGGKCVCEPGWGGEVCHLMTGKGPQLDSVRGGSACDLQSRPCRKIFIDASNLDLCDDLTCKVQEIDSHGHPVGKAITADAHFLSAGRISCALPRTDKVLTQYKVSASNDAKLYGNDLSVSVYNSKCVQCSANNTCTPKSTACTIDNICFFNGDINPTNPQQTCDAKQNTHQWTTVYTSATLTPEVKGPNDDFLFTCSFDASKTSGDIKVTWTNHNVVVKSETLSQGQGQSQIPISDIHTPAILMCSVQTNDGKVYKSRVYNLV